MARTPTKDYRPLGLDDWLDETNYYDDEAMREVMKVVARHLSSEGSEYAKLHAELRSALNSSAALFRFNSNREVKPTPSTLIKDFEKIETAATRLLIALHTPNGELDELPPLLRWDGGLESRAIAQMATENAATREYRFPASVRGASALREALKGIRQIRDWAKQSRELNEAFRKEAEDGQRQSWLDAMAPEDRFIYVLTGTWREVLGRLDINSADFRNFAFQALVVLDREVTTDAIRGRIERLQQRIRELGERLSINQD